MVPTKLKMSLFAGTFPSLFWGIILLKIIHIDATKEIIMTAIIIYAKVYPGMINSGVSILSIFNIPFNANYYEFFGYVITEMRHKGLHIYRKTSYSLKSA